MHGVAKFQFSITSKTQQRRSKRSGEFPTKSGKILTTSDLIEISQRDAAQNFQNPILCVCVFFFWIPENT
jgi:hypothetical protein